MKKQLVSRETVRNRALKGSSNAPRKSAAPENSGMTKTEIAKAMKRLKRSGYKVPAKLKPRALPQD